MQTRGVRGCVRRVSTLNFISGFFTVFAFLVLTACGGGGGSPNDPSPIDPTDTPTGGAAADLVGTWIFWLCEEDGTGLYERDDFEFAKDTFVATIRGHSDSNCATTPVRTDPYTGTYTTGKEFTTTSGQKATELDLKFNAGGAISDIFAIIDNKLYFGDDADDDPATRPTALDFSYYYVKPGNSNVTPPAAPTGIAAVSGNTQATISWSPVSGATSYNLYMASVAGVTKSNYATQTGGMRHAGVTSPYVHTGLTNDTTYYFVMAAVNANGESVGSSEVAVVPMAGGTTGSVSRVAAGGLQTCALMSNGTVKCWGG